MPAQALVSALIEGLSHIFNHYGGDDEHLSLLVNELLQVFMFSLSSRKRRLKSAVIKFFRSLVKRKILVLVLFLVMAAAGMVMQNLVSAWPDDLAYIYWSIQELNVP